MSADRTEVQSINIKQCYETDTPHVLRGLWGGTPRSQKAVRCRQATDSPDVRTPEAPPGERRQVSKPGGGDAGQWCDEAAL